MEGTNPDSSAYFDKVKKAFKDKTQADLDVQMVPWTAAKDKFTTSIAGNTTPDVAEVGTTWTPEFADAGALADLTAKVKAAKLDGDLVAGLKDAGTVDGKLYGMPWYAGIRSFLYNKDIFAKAGITTPPATWAELKDAVAKIKKADPAVTPFFIPGNSEFTATPFIWGPAARPPPKRATSGSARSTTPRRSKASSSSPTWPSRTAPARRPPRPAPRRTPSRRTARATSA